MTVIRNRDLCLSLCLLIFLCSALRQSSYRRLTFAPSRYARYPAPYLTHHYSRCPRFSVLQLYEGDYYSSSQSPTTELSPADIFLSLLESQLAIIVQSTNVTHAAIYMSSEGDDYLDDEEPVMQLVCSYPPTLRTDDIDGIGSIRQEFNDNDINVSAPNNVKARENAADGRKDVANNSGRPKVNKDAVKKETRVVVESDFVMDIADIEIDEDDILKPGWGRPRGESTSTVYPIQFQGANLGILQTMINTPGIFDDAAQNIPVFDFYDYRSSSKASSWNPYNPETSVSSCRVCGSVAVSLGASIALELVRISSAAEAELLNRSLRQRGDNVFLRTSSAVITTKTLLKLISKRLPKDDDIGVDIIKAINDQSDSISEAVLQLIKVPSEVIEGEEYIVDSESHVETDEKEADMYEEMARNGEGEYVVEEEARDWILDEVDAEDDTEGEMDPPVYAGDALDGDLPDLPYVVRTVDTMSVHAHDAHAASGTDEDNGGEEDVLCQPIHSVSHFFPYGDRINASKKPAAAPVLWVSSNSETVLDTDIVRTPGVDFVFLETFESKESEVYVTFEENCLIDVPDGDESDGHDHTSDGVSETDKDGSAGEKKEVAEICTSDSADAKVRPTKKASTAKRKTR